LKKLSGTRVYEFNSQRNFSVFKFVIETKYGDEKSAANFSAHSSHPIDAPSLKPLSKNVSITRYRKPAAQTPDNRNAIIPNI